MATDEPMLATVAGRYAAALFELASEQNNVAGVEAELVGFRTLLEESADLRNLVRSPLYSLDDQARAVEAIAAKIGLGTPVSNLLRVLVRNRRLAVAGDVVKAFQALAAQSRGEVTAEVASASPLSDEQIADLKAALKASVGKEVQLATRVDSSLLGGLVVRIGSRMIDSSLRTKLSNLRLGLKGAP
ncbi:MAG: F0F1 ATP synthase subunit delta [Hyphomicrobiaceae bacterium]